MTEKVGLGVIVRRDSELPLDGPISSNEVSYYVDPIAAANLGHDGQIELELSNVDCGDDQCHGEGSPVASLRRKHEAQRARQYKEDPSYGLHIWSKKEPL